METEILIFDIPDVEPTTNKSQKQLEYELMQKNSSISKFHFDNFYEMETAMDMDKAPTTNISSILCKYLLKYFTPIITDKTEDEMYYVLVQSDIPIDVIINDNTINTIPFNTPIKLYGFAIPEICYKQYDKSQLVHYDHIDMKQLALSGNFGLVDLQTGRFTHQRIELNHYGNYNTKKNIIFKNDEDTIKQTNDLIQYVTQMEQYYSENYLTLLNELKFSPYISTKLNTNCKWLYKYLDSHIINDINKIQDRKIGNYTLDAYISMEVDKSNICYYYAKYLGSNNDLFKQQINNKQLHDDELLNYNKQINEGFVKKLEINKKQTIAYHKYATDDLSQLDKKQLSVVELEYNKIEKTLKLITQRGKELQQLFSKLRISLTDVTNIRLKKNIDAIKKILTKEELKGNALLEGGVCLHVLSYAEETLRLFNRLELNQALSKMLINQYSLPKDTSGYFCKYCGEQLMEADNQDIDIFIPNERGIYSAIDDHIQTMIWKEAQYIISTYVKFNILIPIRPLINSIVNGLRDIIITEEIKLYRNKTNTHDNVQNTLVIYINIYIYAVLCAMMLNHPNKIIFGKDKPSDYNISNKFYNKSTYKKEVNAAGEHINTNELFGKIDDGYEADSSDYIITKPKRKNKILRYGTKDKLKYSGGMATNDIKLYERYLLTTALNLILVTKTIVIKRLVTMTPDVIKQIFLKTAYTWAKSYSKPIKFHEISDVDNIKSIIETDSFYNYVYCIKVTNGENVSNTNVKDILGRSIEEVINELKQNINIYSTVQLPKEPKSTDVYNKYVYSSFISMYDYINNEIFRKDSVKVREYYEKYAYVLELEKKMYYDYYITKIRPMFSIEWLNDITKYNDFRPEKIDLAQHYCSDGNRHKTGLYVYENKKSTIELTLSEINSWLKNDDEKNISMYSNYKLVDEQCILCKKKVRFSQSTEKSDKSMSNMFKKIDNILAFYQYYETRCPLGNLHDIVNNICVKCKLNTEFKKKNNIEYYEKYLSMFKDMENEKQSLSVSSLEQAQKKYKIDKLIPISYKSSLSLVAEWSQIANVKYNILVNIGLTEGYKFVDIEKSRINPSKDLSDKENTNEINKTRSMKIKSYIFAILRDYNKVLNWENVIDMPIELKNIINKQKSINITRVSESIPNILSGFDVDANYKYTLSNAEYANWLLEFLASIFVRIHKKTSDTYKSFGYALIMHFTNWIISQEQLFSKAPHLVYKNINTTKADTDSEEEVHLSGDDNAQQTQSSASEFEDENDAKNNEKYENEINDEAFDVEDAAQVWELE